MTCYFSTLRWGISLEPMDDLGMKILLIIFPVDIEGSGKRDLLRWGIFG